MSTHISYKYVGSIILCALFTLSSNTYSASVTYTSQPNFLTALGGSGATLDFEAQTSGDIINSGTSIGDISFSYSIGPPPTDMMVTNDFLTTSGNNYLGLDDAGNFNLFIAGDAFSMSFATPTYALGMYFVSGDPLFNGDIQLITSSGTALNSDVIDVTLGDGGLAYYVGLISDTAFNSASIQFDVAAEGAFLYSVDDITTSTSVVPVPAAVWLFGSGLIGLIHLGKRRK